MLGKDVTKEISEIADSLRENIVSAITGRYGIAVSGSIGKGTNDGHSDYDFRLYYDERSDSFGENWKKVQETIAWWAERGRIIDGVWSRSIGEIDAGLKLWLEGTIVPQELDWAIWGYYLPTDIQNQKIIEDPFDVLVGWKALLSEYSPALKQAVLDKFLPFLLYWRDDYHYAHKVGQGDTVFAFSLAAKIIHAAVQLVFAVNERYYVGDGKNLEFVAEMERVPDGFASNVSRILYGPSEPDDLPGHHEKILALITSVEQFLDANRG